MKKQGKILLTNIKAGKDKESSIRAYFSNLSTAFLNYSVTKLALNYFTMKEMADGNTGDERAAVMEYLSTIDSEITKAFSDEKGSVSFDKMLGIRDKITEKMKILTAYTDMLEIYEYILNRKEYSFTGETEEVDIYNLAERMFNFVFSDNDKVIINSKIQSLVAQLPVRMTKQRFYDIISASMDIYKGGEKKSVSDFALSIENAAGLTKPDGFETMYPGLYDAYKKLCSVDYKNLSSDEYNELTDIISESTDTISDNVTDYLMLQEIVNDTLIVLFNINKDIDKSLLPKSYESACTIIKSIAKSDDIYEASLGFDNLFTDLEGAQEDAYETLSMLVSGFYEITEAYMDDASDDLNEYAKLLTKSDLLTSSSLFTDLDSDVSLTPFSVVNETADADYLKGLKEELFGKFDKAFENISKFEKRSMMAKVLSLVPVFFNTQQEIKDYFEYTLSRCNDKDELLCCSRLIEDIMEG